MYVFHEHKYIIAGSLREYEGMGGVQGHEHLQIPVNGGKNRLKNCFTGILPVPIPA